MVKTKREYALYKGDSFLIMGTIEEIANKLNKSFKTIYYYTTPLYKRRCKNSIKRLTMVEID